MATSTAATAGQMRGEEGKPAMRIAELFAASVTRDIPPVVYFHEQDPQRLAEEVGEYIITGGYPDGHPRASKLKHGIHEQFVRLLTAIASELEKKGGPELPASWISGFYGSGKSSFAKLLGLALDGRTLPDGTSLAEALLRRDDSPRAQELVDAWKRLRTRIDPIAVVFDVGGKARDGEHIHAVVLRQIQERLGYSPDNRVADYELKLEQDGLWEKFIETAERRLGQKWEYANREQLADENLSEVMHALFPERFRDPMSWVDSRAGATDGVGTSAEEAVKSIAWMLERRAKGKTLFIVVDEVSQYVHQDDQRMLKLQSFVSELGQRLRGKVWLLATGQQKLEEASESTTLGKLKERFPASLRVHLAATNIRDVVHRRLLKKAPDKEQVLRDLFQKHRNDLRLHAYGCEEITEEDFVEVYPMLPGHVDLLLRITTALRSRSSRMQGDDHAIRGLLQLLGEIFRTQKLADAPVGRLVTLEAVFEVQHSALDSDAQNTLARIFQHPLVEADPMVARVAKAVALLENVQEESEPTKPELVAKVLYADLGQGSQLEAVTAALEKLREENLLGYSEKHGYKLQSSAGQEWASEREGIGVAAERVSELVQEKLKTLIATPERPRLQGQPFPWLAFYSDGRRAKDLRLVDPRTDATMTVDLRFVSEQERRTTEWIKLSDEGEQRNRLLWVCGDHGAVDELARELGKSEAMLKRYKERSSSLSPARQKLVIEEMGRCETLQGRLAAEVEKAFLSGTLYFRAKAYEPRTFGQSFGSALLAAANRILPELYTSFTPIAVTNNELEQLLQPSLAGPSPKFGENQLGILSLDSGKYVFTCAGPVPSSILRFIEQEKGVSGGTLLSYFGRPPFGYPADVVRACVVGLLRATKIRIRPGEGKEITSVLDEGIKEVLTERGFRHADLFLNENAPIKPKDLVAIARFFEKHLGLKDIERQNDAIADAVYSQFPRQRSRLSEVEARFDRLPGRPQPPAALDKLAKALEDCRRSRQVEDIVVAVKRNLDALRDGIEQLGILHASLTDEEIARVVALAEVRDHHLAQLEQFGGLQAESTLEYDAAQLRAQLESVKPWAGSRAVEDCAERIRTAYVAVRGELLNQQTAAVEVARARVKSRDGFALLDADQSNRVLRPFAEAMFDTTAEAVAPKLTDLRDLFPGRLQAAEEQANQRLDEILEQKKQKPVARVQLSLTGREIADEHALKILLTEIEERIKAQLAEGKRVRLL